ncbi:MAG: hypothetical protein KJ698_06110 [Actinobacteria bacterium]|nr:hypothetical protein [Actinomycetota bacterium]MBU1494976.1 hypothetical protein [Actinomycetota bacterium]
MVHVAGEMVPAGLFWAGIVVIVLGALGFWVLAGNLGAGDAEAGDVRSRFRSFAEAVADGDGAAACAMIEEANAAAFAERAALNLGIEPGTCTEMIDAFAAGRTDQASTLLRGVEILDVRMLGGDAAIELPPDRAEVAIEAGTVTFSRDAGCAGSSDCWIVTDGGPVFRMADPTRGG